MIACPVCLTSPRSLSPAGKWSACACRRLACNRLSDIWQFSAGFSGPGDYMEVRSGNLRVGTPDGTRDVPEAEREALVRRFVDSALTQIVMES